jgi:hypothetical protein
MSKDLGSGGASAERGVKGLLNPIVERYNNHNSQLQSPLSRGLLNSNNNQGSAADLISYAAVPGSRVSPIRQNYMQQKKILQQVYGA